MFTDFIRLPKFVHSKWTRIISLEVTYILKGSFPINFNVKGFIKEEQIPKKEQRLLQNTPGSLSH